MCLVHCWGGKFGEKLKIFSLSCLVGIEIKDEGNTKARFGYENVITT